MGEKKVETEFQADMDASSSGKTLQLGCCLGAVLIYIQWQSVFPHGRTEELGACAKSAF